MMVTSATENIMLCARTGGIYCRSLPSVIIIDREAREIINRVKSDTEGEANENRSPCRGGM